MSQLSARMLRVRKREEPRDELPEQERSALRRMRKEARGKKAKLATGGKGGLPPSLVLGVMRRDEFRCKSCGGSGRGEGEGGLSVHHKSEHLEDPKAKARSRLLGREGKVNTPANLVTVCARCHDGIHEKDRTEHGDAD